MSVPNPADPRTGRPYYEHRPESGTLGLAPLSEILVNLPSGDQEVTATVATDRADEVVALLCRGAREQDRNKYTASARLYARAAAVESFRWVD